jgi:hypothetical protein
MSTEWIEIEAMRPGDRVKVPDFSSWAGWPCRDVAERSDQPFREVVRVIIGWEGTRRIRLCFQDGYACQLPRTAHVLRAHGY